MANFERTLLLAIASLENTTAGDIYNVEQGRDGLTVYSTKATKKFPDEIKKYLVKKYQKGNRMILSTRAGSLRVVPDDIYINFVKRTKSSASKMAKKGSSIKSFACRTAFPKPNGSFCSTKLKVIESKLFGFTNLR